MTTQIDHTLGNAPPRSLDSVMAGLVRLHRLYDLDDEERQSRGTLVCGHQHPDLIRLRVVDALVAWLKPAVEAERELDAADAELQRAKDARWPG